MLRSVRVLMDCNSFSRTKLVANIISTYKMSQTGTIPCGPSLGQCQERIRRQFYHIFLLEKILPVQAAVWRSCSSFTTPTPGTLVSPCVRIFPVCLCLTHMSSFFPLYQYQVSKQSSSLDDHALSKKVLKSHWLWWHLGLQGQVQKLGGLDHLALG